MLCRYFTPPPFLHESDEAGVGDWWVHITYSKSLSSTCGQIFPFNQTHARESSDGRLHVLFCFLSVLFITSFVVVLSVFNMTEERVVDTAFDHLRKHHHIKYHLNK